MVVQFPVSGQSEHLCFTNGFNVKSLCIIAIGAERYQKRKLEIMAVAERTTMTAA
jgi:hypothetical protein